jgi:hypothetical protein
MYTFVSGDSKVSKDAGKAQFHAQCVIDPASFLFH